MQSYAGIAFTSTSGAHEFASSADAAAWTDHSSAINGGGGLCIVRGPGKYVALGIDHAFTTDQAMTSPDGITWTSQTIPQSSTQPYQALCYGGGLYVGHDQDGTIITSPDGITWANPATVTAPFNGWIDIAYGAGLYVMVGKNTSLHSTDHTIATSPDGSAWTTILAPSNPVAWQGVCYGGGRFVAVGLSGKVATSPDGAAWTAQSSGNTSSWIGVAFTNGVYVAVASTGAVMTSPDGVAWTLQSASLGSGVKRVRAINGGFVAAGGTTAASIHTSPDGVTWGTETTPIKLQDVAAHPASNFMAIARSATGTEQIMISADVVVWEAISSPTDGQGGFTIASFGANKFSALCLDAAGTTWIAATTTDGGDTWTSNAVSQPVGAYVDMIFAGGKLVGLADSGEVVTSPNGITWTLAATLTGTGWRSLTYKTGLYAAIGAFFPEAVATSPDAVTWTLQNTNVGGNPNTLWEGIIFGGSQFVAVSKFGIDPFGEFSVMTSPDGATWTGRVMNGTDLPPMSAEAVAFGAGTYVAPGDGAAPDNVYTSTDGVTWTGHTVADVNTPAHIRFVDAVTPPLFIICVTSPTTGTESIVTSPDGFTWTTQTAALDKAYDVAPAAITAPSPPVGGFGNVFGGMGAGMTQNPANCFV